MSLRHAVLGFLSLKPLTGYDLKKYFDGSVGHFWNADQAQIYRALTQLTEDGLVHVRVVPQEGRPARREHHLTDSGRAELDAWLRAPAGPQAVREPFMVQVFFAGRLPVAETTALLDARIAATRERLGVLRAIAAQSATALDAIADTDTTGTGTTASGAVPSALDRLLATATLENGIRHLTAELDWLRDLRTDLDDLHAAPARIRRRLDRAVSDGHAHHPGQDA
ncbi:PadR family transcriptional regulator [Planobispora longispora]|uniref:PadR family transcriptional regulator n=1 Tax=Planobispora longispora TaxID=28887 RepID=A0A8J3RFP6_9ACTN|nr:PadR family transcriptional regulator [Planobispora longispora]BFE77660.1 hypothetical protein GCM10020093_002610 [Planobispora longispora]GIH73870.1 hypothetical protein Plo01_02990 [Planobispora longispora]